MPGLRQSHRDDRLVDTTRSRIDLWALPRPESEEDDLVTRSRVDGAIFSQGKNLLRKRRTLRHAALLIGRNLPAGLA